MVGDAVFGAGEVDAVLAFPGFVALGFVVGVNVAVPDADPQVAKDHVMGLDDNPVISQSNPVAGRGLPFDGDQRFGDRQLGVEPNVSRDAETDDSRPGRMNRLAKAAGTGVVQTLDVENLAPASAGSESAESFSSFESGLAGLRGERIERMLAPQRF